MTPLVSGASKNKNWAKYRDRFLCPCCFMPTLDGRAGYEICSICFWEDDGQDTDDAEIIRGGPNADYSLEEARENFKHNHTMYRASDERAFNREIKEMPMKKKIYQAFSHAIKTGIESDWVRALEIENEYHNHS